MKSVIIIYHSGYGHTKRQAGAVFDGASQIDGVRAQLIVVSDVEKHWDDLHKANAIIFGAPTYMGSISAEFKKFMELSSPFWMKQLWKDKLAAGFTNSGSMNGDKFNSITQLVTFAAQHSMIWVGLGLMPASSSKAVRDDINYLGGYTGALSQSDVDLGADLMPHKGDLDTASHLGKRVAELVKCFNLVGN